MSDDYVLDTPGFGRSSTASGRRSRRPRSPEAACDAIRPALRRAARRPGLAPGRAHRADVPGSGMGGGIGQWLLYRAERRSLSLFALVVPSGVATPVHDHLAWGLVGLYRGTQDEEIYAGDGDALELVERRALRAGRLLCTLPAARRHPPRDDDLGRDVGLDPPADERHRLHLAAHVRPRDGFGAAVPLRLRERRLRRPRPLDS